MTPEFLALSILVLLFSVIVHEVMHGYVALRFGDRTALNAGRLTLNPLPHIDPIGTILLPALLLLSHAGVVFGWAKPVPINPLHFSNIKWGELLVSLAGILSNLGIAIISGVILHLLNAFSIQNILSEVFAFAIRINLLLAVFNLIPLPPLDGSKVLMALLPYNLAKSYQKLEPYGFILLLVLWYIPVGGGSLLEFILGNGTTILITLLGF